MDDLGNISHVNRTMGMPDDPIEQKIVESLRTIYDPEIPVNIYDMGLIYEIQIDENKQVRVLMTLTSPNCPAAQYLPSQVESVTREVESVTGVEVEIVWEPTWGREMMSEAALLELGMM